MKLFYRILTGLLALTPLRSFANLPQNYGRLPDPSWEELEAKIYYNRLPQTYYDKLKQYGIYSFEQLQQLQDENVKTELLEMYKRDQLIIFASDRTRSNG